MCWVWARMQGIPNEATRTADRHSSPQCSPGYWRMSVSLSHALRASAISSLRVDTGVQIVPETIGHFHDLSTPPPCDAKFANQG